MNDVFTYIIDEPTVNKKEIMRYMGAKPNDDLDGIIDRCLSEAKGILSYTVCGITLPVEISGNRIILPQSTLISDNLAKNLSGCESVMIFAATVGVGIDRLIAKYSRISPSSALCFQAIGAERVEALCDEFCNRQTKKLAEDGLKLKPRFSPGYGDLPLETQKMIFSLLNCPKRIGVTLGDSLLMSPSKSVTAFAGITRCKVV